MIRVSTHLFGSTDGYQTLAKSADVSEIEERALAIFGFGSPKSKEEIDLLVQQPSVAGRLLPSGRFAITRLFPGDPDVAGRSTVERRSILFTAQDWKVAVRCDIGSLLNDEQAFDRAAFLKSQPHSVQVNESDDLMPHAGELERRLYDILLATPHQNACALLPDDSANRGALLHLLKLLPIKEACHLSWGLGLFAATPGVRLATASVSVAATPNVRWPSLTGPLQHPDRVATLGMDLDSRIATLKVEDEELRQHGRLSLAQHILKYLSWIITGLVLILLAVLFLISRMRTPPAGAPTQRPNPIAPEKSSGAAAANETPTAPAIPSSTAPAPPIAPATIPPEMPSTTPSATPPTTAESVPANAAPANSQPPSTTDLPTPEPANIAEVERDLWSQARTLLTSVRTSPATAAPSLKVWLNQTKDQADKLVAVQQKIAAEARVLKSTTKNYWFDLTNKSALRLVELPGLNDADAEMYCRASILLLTQCDLLSAQQDILRQLNVLALDPKKALTADQAGRIDELGKKLRQDLARPEIMTMWMTPNTAKVPNESMSKSLYAQLSELHAKMGYKFVMPPQP